MVVRSGSQSLGSFALNLRQPLFSSAYDVMPTGERIRDPKEFDYVYSLVLLTR